MLSIGVFLTALSFVQGTLVSGSVFDSVAMRHIARAKVTLVGASDSILGRSVHTVADSQGRFEVPGLVEGDYIIAFDQPRLDSLDLEPPLRKLRVNGAHVHIELATPTSWDLQVALCGGGSQHGTAVVAGRVYGLQGEPSDSAEIEFRRLSAIAGDTTLDSTTTIRPQSGVFVFCALPASSTILLRASRSNLSTGTVRVSAPEVGFTYVPLFLGESRLDSEGRKVGTRRMVGVIRSAVGQPISGASAQIAGTQRSATSDSGGRFSLTNLPGGTQTLELRRIGYSPKQWIVHLTPFDSARLAFELEESPAVLEAVAVTAARSLAGFESRRRTSPVAAHFFPPSELQLRGRDQPLSSIVDGLPGVRKVCGGGICSIQMRRMSSTMTRTGMETCTPSIYVDGSRDRVVESDVDILRAGTIAAIEVYTRESQLPAEFTTMGNRRPCGVIVVWLRKQ